jgi:hypothetical protein
MGHTFEVGKRESEMENVFISVFNWAELASLDPIRPLAILCRFLQWPYFLKCAAEASF